MGESALRLLIVFVTGVILGGIIGFVIGEVMGTTDTERRWSEAIRRKEDDERRRT